MPGKWQAIFGLKIREMGVFGKNWAVENRAEMEMGMRKWKGGDNARANALKLEKRMRSPSFGKSQWEKEFNQRNSNL
ncbi:MAG: hypothetical protein SFV55_14050 [Haliscomenobacter sp.]|uniref:hypothetical protein n=1 Tax=Haliscomenobacter sp. TaxID=2717303 RepID=UPI0029B2D924|nr:hypothetical protein [Haliscomenobacter sp.]MDX2069546.1 hypothetical protein [Haliscomenobacter sp.]